MTKNCFKRFRLTGTIANPVGTQYCGDIGFLLDFHCHVDRLGIDTEVTSLYDISLQYHKDVVAIT